MARFTIFVCHSLDRNFLFFYSTNYELQSLNCKNILNVVGSGRAGGAPNKRVDSKPHQDVRGQYRYLWPRNTLDPWPQRL